jgi:diguanylate cyclase (GGDEF)-like protein/PAS domain S-box-containing protein
VVVVAQHPPENMSLSGDPILSDLDLTVQDRAPVGGGRWQRALSALPRGRTLSVEEWDRRHRIMCWLLWAHVPALVVFLLCQGFGLWGAAGPVLPIVVAGVVAQRSEVERRAKSIAVVFGLLTASAVLVYGWHGQIEAHFHFFVIIAVLAFYEDWLPFGLAIAYVAIEHGLLGALAPRSVYSHGGNPWGWAAVHAGFVLAASVVAVITWRMNETTRSGLRLATRRAGEQSRRFRISFESAISGMCILDSDGNYLQVNRALCEMLGYSEAELLRTAPGDLTHPEDRDREIEAVLAVIDEGSDVYTTEKRYLHRDGTTVWAQVGLRAVRDEAGELAYFLVQVNDITERNRFEAELKRGALHDPLTDLPNRRLFLDRVQGALDRLLRRPEPLTVMFVDLDRFKLVNDTFGHGVGDIVLAEAARRLQDALRSQDTVARFGGDEFTVLCERADEGEAARLGARIHEALALPFHHGDREFQLSASVGARVTNSPHVAAEILLQEADSALYIAKQKGGGRVELYRTGGRGDEVDQLETEHGLRRAIGAGELRLHYQPELDLAGAGIVAVEALVRWEHPERGLLGPFEFVPLAEQSGLIIELGDWVLDEACRQMAQWREAGLARESLRVAVNVSPRQLSDPSLAESVIRALERSGLDPQALCLEITENALVSESQVALANLREIHRLGVGVALDDFGVGFSSLSRIRDLPRLDVIKIDRSFIAGMGDSRPDAAVVRAALSLGRHLELIVVAEGIESPEQVRELQRLGCGVGQGFLFARPLAPEQVAELLKADEPLAGLSLNPGGWS